MSKSSSARRTAATVVQDEDDKNLYVINIKFYYSYINMIYSTTSTSKCTTSKKPAPQPIE